MRKKLVTCLLSVLMLFAFSTIATADSITVGDEIYLTQVTGNTNGGPFKVREYGSSDVLFITFCLERNEWTSVPLTVESITNAAIQGGISGGNPDPLDELTAYLYYSFRTGSAQYDLDALQVAIWKIENENDSSWQWYQYWATYGTAAKSYIDDATAAISAGWTNDNRIQVMNLTYIQDGVVVDAQSQLIYVPEPMSIFLLGLGILGLGFSRRLRK